MSITTVVVHRQLVGIAHRPVSATRTGLRRNIMCGDTSLHVNRPTGLAASRHCCCPHAGSKCFPACASPSSVRRCRRYRYRAVPLPPPPVAAISAQTDYDVHTGAASLPTLQSHRFIGAVEAQQRRSSSSAANDNQFGAAGTRRPARQRPQRVSLLIKRERPGGVAPVPLLPPAHPWRPVT